MILNLESHVGVIFNKIRQTSATHTYVDTPWLQNQQT